MSFNNTVGLKFREDLEEEFYNFNVESLKKYSPLSEEDLKELDGIDFFKYNLSICILEKIKIKGIRNIKKNYKESIIDNKDIIKKGIYDFYTNKYKFMDIYGKIKDDDWGLDGELFNIINNFCWEKYGFRFIDYEILKIQVNNAHMNSCNVDKMLDWLFKKVNNNKHIDSWQKVLEFREV